MRILITGVFDVLHDEHVIFLQKAKALGERLIVGIESDIRVRSLKGEGRPINTQRVRKENLEKLAIADEVFVLPETFVSDEDHRMLLQKVHPDILAVSSHTPHLAKKQQLMQEIGGRVVVVHDHNRAVSSTILIQKQRASHNG
jgi:cytidyltransferase-like protein